VSIDNPFTVTDLRVELDEISGICPADTPIRIFDEEGRRYEIIDIRPSLLGVVLKIRPRASS
jgi:hypothetical protein